MGATLSLIFRRLATKFSNLVQKKNPPVPVFEGEKWRRLDALWNVLFERFAVAWGVEEVFKISSIQSSDEGIEPPQFSTAITFKRGTSAQIGEGLTCASCRCHVKIGSPHFGPPRAPKI